jgi:hypothetical protein
MNIVKKSLVLITFLAILPQFSALNAQKSFFNRFFGDKKASQPISPSQNPAAPRIYLGKQQLSLAQVQVLLAQQDPQLKQQQSQVKPLLPKKPSNAAINAALGLPQQQVPAPVAPQRPAPRLKIKAQAAAQPMQQRPTASNVQAKKRFFEALTKKS